jgi:membrane protease YdiL (CAAX protease family)
MGDLNENPLMILAYLGVAAYVLKLYLSDYRLAQAGHPNPKALPGAEPFSGGLIWVGVAGALLLLGLETSGELSLGIAAEQSEMIWYFVFAALGAGIVEEVIFRGFLVVESKGRFILIASCIGFSLVFALIHGHLWDTEESFTWTFTAKAWFSTGILFANSLFFYALRFCRWNLKRSIFPCMIAHAVSNLGVFFVKLAQGYIIF